MRTIKLISPSCVFLLLVCAAGTEPQSRNVQLSSRQWLGDLDFLAREMPKRHKNLFHFITPTKFRSEIARLRKDIPTLSQSEIVVRFMEIGAMIHDAHTGISPILPELRFEALPLRLYLYKDGLFVQAASPQHAELVGAKVIRIGKYSAEEAMQRVRIMQDASNESTVRDFLPYKLVRPAILQAMGVSEDPEKTTFVFSLNGVEKTVPLSSMGRKSDGAPEMGGIGFEVGAEPLSHWIDARSNSNAPLWLQHQDLWYWDKYLPEQKILYIQCNVVGNQEKRETLKDFFQNAFHKAATRHVRKMIIDLRLNGGGDNTLILPVIHGIIKMDEINRRGRLFTIIGRRTQSAAQNFVNLLQKHTETLFVGEPTGESPNHYGEPDTFQLPNSKLEVHVSTLWWQDMDPRDTRETTKPDIWAELTSKDYRENHDPALDEIVNYK